MQELVGIRADETFDLAAILTWVGALLFADFVATVVSPLVRGREWTWAVVPDGLSDWPYYAIETLVALLCFYRFRNHAARAYGRFSISGDGIRALAIAAGTVSLTLVTGVNEIRFQSSYFLGLAVFYLVLPLLLSRAPVPTALFSSMWLRRALESFVHGLLGTSAPFGKGFFVDSIFEAAGFVVAVAALTRILGPTERWLQRSMGSVRML